MRLMKWGVVVTGILLAAGCATGPKPGDPGTGAAIGPDGIRTASGISGISRRTIHFDFDSAGLRSEAGALLDQWATWLAKHPQATVRLEGHADERGTPEYNVGLGERRGNSVRDALMARGAAAGQLEVVSYGEDRPVATGHTERDWARNRRVEIID